MLSKIGNSIVLAFLGLFLGAMLGIFYFASIHFIRNFTLWALGVFAFVFLINLLNLRKSDKKNKVIGLFFSTLFAGLILCGIAGMGWILAGEDFEYDFLDSVIFIILVPIAIIGTAVMIPLRMVWHETRIGRSVGQTIRGTKVLLGIGESKKPQTNDQMDKQGN